MVAVILVAVVAEQEGSQDTLQAIEGGCEDKEEEKKELEKDKSIQYRRRKKRRQKEESMVVWFWLPWW